MPEALMYPHNTITGIGMHDINRSAILDYIRRKGPAFAHYCRELTLSLRP
jgi:hypothetical protein